MEKTEICAFFGVEDDMCFHCFDCSFQVGCDKPRFHPSDELRKKIVFISFKQFKIALGHSAPGVFLFTESFTIAYSKICKKNNKRVRISKFGRNAYSHLQKYRTTLK